MQKFSQKYTIVQLLEPQPEGTEYDWRDWPLHVTLADIFAIDWTVATLVEELGSLSSHAPATSIATEEALLGTARVVLLEKTPRLMQLHVDIIKLLEQGNARFNNPEHIKAGFLPHSTIQKNRRLYKGDIVPFSALTLIDMFPHQDPYRRRILKTIPLKR